MKKRITIQGYQGSFHEVAAQKAFGSNIEVVPCANFRQLVQKTQQDNTIHGAVMAIENSIAGSILPNYSLLQNSSLVISGEVYLPISQNLLVNRGVTLKEIHEVQSHPMALLQCADYLDQYKWKLVETEDTALSAKFISENKKKHTAAIASSLAAELYDLEVLEADIQTEKTNYTRFLVLQRKTEAVKQASANKASVFFEINHQTGGLAKVLSIIAAFKLNLSKIQSIPLPKDPWKYAFHVDMEFEGLPEFHTAIEEIKKETDHLMIYGIYKKGL
jgi:prephenate dehydratase